MHLLSHRVRSVDWKIRGYLHLSRYIYPMYTSMYDVTKSMANSNVHKV